MLARYPLQPQSALPSRALPLRPRENAPIQRLPRYIKFTSHPTLALRAQTLQEAIDYAAFYARDGLITAAAINQRRNLCHYASIATSTTFLNDPKLDLTSDLVWTEHPAARRPPAHYHQHLENYPLDSFSPSNSVIFRITAARIPSHLPKKAFITVDSLAVDTLLDGPAVEPSSDPASTISGKIHHKTTINGAARYRAVSTQTVEYFLNRRKQQNRQRKCICASFAFAVVLRSSHLRADSDISVR